MSDDDLRDKLTEALTECSGADIDEDLDALMPVVRRALAQAWDEGHADGAHNEHEFRPGRKITNPWREDD